MPALFALQAQLRPLAPAVVWAGGTLTYADLDARSTALARHLRDAGLVPGEPVALFCESSPELLVAAMGIWKAGGAYLPVDPAYPAERAAFIVSDSGARIVLARRGGASPLQGGSWKTLFVEDLQACESGSSLPSPAEPDDLAYIIYTSGSTGVPKGVEIAHGNLQNLVAWHNREFSITAADRATQIAGPGFDAAVWEIWPYLAAGAAIHIPSPEDRYAAERLLGWLVSQQITVSFLPTVLAEQVLRLPWPKEAPLRLLLTGGDALHLFPPAGLPFTLVNNYGPSECTVVATSAPIPAAAGQQQAPSIGRAISNTRIWLLDGQLRQVAEGEVGEMFIGGASVGRGYRNRPDLTAQAFLTIEAEGVPQRVYRTGDLARRLPSGEFAFAGRADDQIKIRGFRIEPDEIAAVLNRHPQVVSSAVAARSDGGEKRLVAYVVVSPGADISDPELRDLAAQSLPDYMVPASFVALERIPTTANGKLDKAALPPPTAENQLRRDAYIAPKTELEEMVAGIVGPILGLPRVSAHDNFFLLGGHSLMGAQVIAKVREVFDVEINLRTVFQCPTVAKLAAKIEESLVQKLEAMSEEEVDQALAGQSSAGSTFGAYAEKAAQ
jgi:amino acid adenylation domain-containing protein